MLIRIPAVLTTAALQQVRQMLGMARFVDGKLSAGSLARREKHNEEVARDDTILAQLNNVVMTALVRHALYQAAALPRKVATPYYARYTEGMGYGPHVDDPVMGEGEPYRSDIAVTLFLNAPESYAGGELIIRTPFGEQVVKYPAGDAVLYPASSLHQVARVTAGERLVAVTWVQSLVRDPAQREVLFDLWQARERMRRDAPDGEATRQVDRSYVNLVRMWADT